MPRRSPTDASTPGLENLLAWGEGAPSLPEKLDLARRLRAAMSDGGAMIDQILLTQIARMHDGLRTAEQAQRELRALMERLTAPPWHPALFLRAVATPIGPRAMVLHGGGRRVVALADDVALADLLPGEEVFLDGEGNVVAGRSSYGVPPFGETASFERTTSDGRCVLRWRDDEVVVDAAGTLDVSALVSGDRVRWDRAAWMAFEKLELGTQHEFFLDDVPRARREDVGGQGAALAAVLAALTATLVAPERAAAYGLEGRRTILLVGPPGCGKTLIARVAVAEVARLSGRRCRFAVVKPAAWESPWVGTTQARIASLFRALGAAAVDGYAVLFLDEIESIGRTRGSVGGEHGDKFLGALLAELDGFATRANIAVVAATNRADLLDSALASRFDLEVRVGRPDLRGARAIFDLHLPATVPMHADEGDPDTARRRMLDAAVARLFAPNADNAVCTLTFRDGATRGVTARELVSGRLIAQIVRAACRRACLRDVERDEPGLLAADFDDAVADAIARLATTLTRRNVHDHLVDLAPEADVVSVTPVVRRTRAAHRYVRAA
jgi:ATP-dependent 26S proteasome regulatory subunit